MEVTVAAPAGAAVRATWENEGLQCMLANNMREGIAAENDNAAAGKVHKFRERGL